MRDLGQDAAAGGASGAIVGPRLLGDLDSWTKRLAMADEPLTDAHKVDVLRKLEELTCAAAGLSAEMSADFDASQRAKAARAGVPADRQGRGVASQIGLAKRVSPHRAQRQLGIAKLLRRGELPHTRAAFRDGEISEYKVMLMVRETACLTLENRMLIDGEVAGVPGVIEAMGDRELVGAVRKRVYALEPRAFVERRKRSEAERHTSTRPAPDVMAFFSALLPVKDAVAIQAALTRAWEQANLAGDPRSKGQIMADTLVERVVHPHLAAVACGTELPLTINLVVRDSVLFGDDDGGGYVDGYGEVPGDLIREWVADQAEQDLEIWIYRLYEQPETGDLVAMDSRGRLFKNKLAKFLRLRDQNCRTQFCDAPIRHLDHSVDRAKGGPTNARYGQGLCETCNHAKQARGWSARPRPGPRHTIETVTPTGHRYTSVAPRHGTKREPKWKLFYPGVIALVA